jgi:predicted esterase
MDPERLDQLQNPDPAVRREAIIALGRSKDLAALPELAKVYKNDPVPELRELARQAGRYIQQENRPAPEPPSPPPDFEPEPASDDTPTPVTPVATTPTPPPAITEADVRRGQSHYRAARNLHEAGEQARAIKELALALHADPGLAHEPVFVTLASQVLGVPPRAAIRTLLDPERRQAAYGVAVAAKRWRYARRRGCAVVPILAGLALFLAIVALGLAIWWTIDPDTIDGLRHRYTVWRLTQDERSLPGGRTYYLYEPSGMIPNSGWSVIVALHGGGATGEDMLTRELMDLADNERALLVAPNLDSLSAFSIMSPSAGAIEDLSAIVTHIREAYAVTPGGVVLYGYDQGARLATAFLAAHPEQVYAVVAESPPGVVVPEPTEDEGVPTPPLTIVFGEADAMAQTTQPEIEALQEQGYQVEVIVVPGQARDMSREGQRALRRYLGTIRSG